MTATTTGVVLAVDGGQSSTRCLIGRTDGTLLAAGVGGPLRHIAEPDGLVMLHRALRDSVGAALAGCSPRPRRALAAYLSLTAASGEAAEFLAGMLPIDRIVAGTDAAGALASGTYGGPGIALVAGTGVVAMAEGPAGERIVMGGWSALLGDEGGSYWIGLAALRAMIRAAEERGPATALTRPLTRALGVTDLRELPELTVTGAVDRVRIAALAPLVVAAGADGDPVALTIVHAAADELATLAAALSARAGFLPSPRTLVATGGVLAADTPLWHRFTAQVGRLAPECRPIRPDLPPAAGAYLLALKLAGLPVTEQTVARTRGSLAALGAYTEPAAQHRPAHHPGEN